METKNGLNSVVGSRETEVARLVHFIQLQDLQSADRMLLSFRKRGERVSREILNAYWYQVHGCYAL